MKKTIFLTIVVLLSTSGLAQGVTRLVPDEYATIQAAIDDSNDGDVVIVASTTYTGDGNRDIDFKGKAITVRSVDPNNPNIVAATIIDCQGTETEQHRGFYFHSSEDCNSVVSGLTIKNGYASYGGAIYCGSSHPTITNCTFRDNTAKYWGEFSTLTPLENRSSMVNYDGEVHINIPPPLPGWRGKGGGICCRLSSPTLINCKFTDNSAIEYGGGIYNYYNSSPILTNCTFTANSASYGGAMRNSSGSPILTNCTFAANSASSGGAMQNSSSSPSLFNCIFNGNSAGWEGGCMSNYRCNPILTNCTFNRNSAAYDGGAIFNIGSDATLINCILWGNAATTGNEIHLEYYSDFMGAKYPSTINVDYSDVNGGAAGVYVDAGCTLNWGTYNIDIDPCFADPCNSDYHLKSQAGRWDPSTQSWVQDNVTSPCIDAGDPMSPICNEPFPNGGRINVGAFGGTAEASRSYFGDPVCETIVAGDINGDCRINFLDFALMALHWLECIEPKQGHLVEDDTEDSYSCEGNFDASFPCSNAIDEDWYTYALPADGGATSYIYENYIIPAGTTRAEFTIKYRQTAAVTPGLCTNVTDYWDGSTWKELDCTALTTQISILTVEIPDEALSGTTLKLRTKTWKGLGIPGSGSGMYYEGKVTWYLLPACRTIVAGGNKQRL